MYGLQLMVYADKMLNTNTFNCTHALCFVSPVCVLPRLLTYGQGTYYVPVLPRFVCLS